MLRCKRRVAHTPSPDVIPPPLPERSPSPHFKKKRRRGPDAEDTKINLHPPLSARSPSPHLKEKRPRAPDTEDRMSALPPEVSDQIRRWSEKSPRCRFLKAKATFENTAEPRSVSIIADDKTLVCKDVCPQWAKYATECIRHVTDAKHLEDTFYLVMTTLRDILLGKGTEKYQLSIYPPRSSEIDGHLVNLIDLRKTRFLVHIHPINESPIVYEFVSDHSIAENGYRLQTHWGGHRSQSRLRDTLHRGLLQLPDVSYKIKILNMSNAPLAEGSLTFGWSTESSQKRYSSLSGVSKRLSS